MTRSTSKTNKNSTKQVLLDEYSTLQAKVYQLLAELSAGSGQFDEYLINALKQEIGYDKYEMREMTDSAVEEGDTDALRDLGYSDKQIDRMMEDRDSAVERQAARHWIWQEMVGMGGGMNTYVASSPTAVTLPAGNYYIGDPCYALDDADYVELIDSPAVKNGAGGEVEIRGHKMYVHRTAHGDGVYEDDSGNEFGVDSGMLSAIPLSLVPPEFAGGYMVATAEHRLVADVSDGAFYFGVDSNKFSIIDTSLIDYPEAA